MYSPTTRLLTVLELLQSHQQMSGVEIARRLEVNTRTIRRYILMLQDMGIPIEAERGPQGAYRLERGRRLPPLIYTDGEAVALTLGLLAIRELQFPVDVASVEGALAKTERVLPEKVLQQVRSLQNAITFHTEDYGFSPPVLLRNDFIVILSAAIQQGRSVGLRYRSWHNEESERDFDPYGIVYNEGYWYTAGYCHLRQDVRTFRLDRIISMEDRPTTFERPADVDVLGLVLHSIHTAWGGYDIEIVLHTSLEHARSVIAPIMGTLEATEAGVVLRRQSSQLEWVAHMLLHLDFPVVIKQPAELRGLLQQMAKRAWQIAESQP